MDEIDKEYLKKLVEKRIAQHDGKTPVCQLDWLTDLEGWAGVNLQGHATTQPKPEEITLALYMIDVQSKGVKRFTITAALRDLMNRDTSKIVYGTTDQKYRQIKVIIQWEKEKRA